MELRRGIFIGAAAYIIWGGSPIFWNAIKQIPPIEVLAWRVLWALPFVVLYIAVAHGSAVLRRALRNPRTLALGIAAGALLAANWALFIWAVTHDHIVDVSLGYYINPLMSVALGVAVLREHLTRWAKIAVAIAALGVVVMTLAAGALPWISLCLAITFALYGLLKKQPYAAPPAEGLLIEMGTAAIPLCANLLWLINRNESAVIASSDSWVLLPFTGIITVVPLLLFGVAAQRIPLAAVGMLQYLAPTIQLLLGVFLYGEVVSSGQWIGFAAVWLAFVIFATDALRGAAKTGRS